MVVSTAVRSDLSPYAEAIAGMREVRSDMAHLHARLTAMLREADLAIERWNQLAEPTVAFTDASRPTTGVPTTNAPNAVTELAPMAQSLTALSQVTTSVTTELPTVDLMQAVADAVVSSEQLTLIRGIDAATAATLNTLGVCRFAEIAALTDADVGEIAAVLGDRRRIARDGWIEQASLLARGIETAHVRRQRTQPVAAAADQPAIVTTVARQMPPQPAPRRPAAGTIVDIAVARDAHRTRRRVRTHMGKIRTFAAYSMIAVIAIACWTGIEMADSNWDGLAALISPAQASPIASLR